MYISWVKEAGNCFHKDRRVSKDLTNICFLSKMQQIQMQISCVYSRKGLEFRHLILVLRAPLNLTSNLILKHLFFNLNINSYRHYHNIHHHDHCKEILNKVSLGWCLLEQFSHLPQQKLILDMPVQLT